MRLRGKCVQKRAIGFSGWESHTARRSEPPLASLGCCLVTDRIKRRQSGNRVEKLWSFEILQSLKGRRSLSMRKATSQYTLSEFAVALAESEGQSCFTMTQSVNWREPVISCIAENCFAGMTYNDDKEEIKGVTGSRTLS